MTASPLSRVRSAVAGKLLAGQKSLNAEFAAALADLRAELAAARTENAELRHQLAVLAANVEAAHTRPGTMDANIWDEVVRQNEYELPEQFRPDDLILDVGGHIGSFSFACLRRGAGRAVCYEPHPDNARYAALNLRRFGDRAAVHRLAVWRSDRPAGVLHWSASSDSANTGGGGIGAAGLAVDAVPFDQVVREAAAASPTGRVRLLKLDCEGSEYPILFTSQTLDLVDAVCGEFHEDEGPPLADARVDGFPRHDRAALADRLAAAGFRVKLVPHRTSPRLGLFFAARPDRG